MLEANFSAFRRNKNGGRRELQQESIIDFRFRNLEKWFDERRQHQRVSSPPTIAPPPGLKRWAKNTDFWNKDELHIPTYDEFVFKDTGSAKNSKTNLLPESWYTAKWRDGYTDDVRNVWFQLPPIVEEGACDTVSDDLPLTVYEGGRAALESLPFVYELQYDFYMTVFQEYYKLFNSGIN